MDITHSAPHLNNPMLFRLSQAELEQLYNTLPAVQISALDGSFRGRVMGVMGIDKLPRFLRVVIYYILQSPLNPWRGKYFAQGAGSNLWLAVGAQVRFGHYVIARDPETDTEYLNYDIDQNGKLLRGIRGEGRQLNEQVVLARMSYQTRAKLHRVLYFTLERA